MIEIATRIRPFTHTPGTPVLLPGSSLEFRIFPARIFVRDLESDYEKIIDIPVRGPVLHFTIMSDLERGNLFISGETTYKIKSGVAGFFVGEEFYPSPGVFERIVPKERLSLGSHKKQDWDLVERRRDLKEILPAWFLLGSWISKDVEEEIDFSKENLLQVFLAHFTGLLSPRLTDEKFQGFALPSIKSPIGLLKNGSDFIRSLFVTSTDDSLSLFPHFVCGRMLNVSVLGGRAELCFEWTKHKPFKVILKGLEACSFQLRCPMEIKGFRVKKNFDQKGESVSVGTLLNLEAGKHLYLDRFTK